jgi:integrase
MPRHPACRKARGYTKNEIGRTLAAAEADPEGYCVLALLLTTGLRRSELLGLGLDTVDLDQATLDVRRTVTQVKGRAVVREVAKTKSSYRTLGIPAAVVLLLLRAQRACALESALAWGRRIFARADVLVSRNGRRAHAAHAATVRRPVSEQDRAAPRRTRPQGGRTRRARMPARCLLRRSRRWN